MKTTKKDFEIFKEECDKWIKFFGLTDWRIAYEWIDIETSNANNTYDSQYKWSVITFSKNYDSFYSETNVKKTAFHEVCHLLVSGFEFLYSQEFRNESMLNRESESFCRIMENSVFKQSHKKTA